MWDQPGQTRSVLVTLGLLTRTVQVPVGHSTRMVWAEMLTRTVQVSVGLSTRMVWVEMLTQV